MDECVWGMVVVWDLVWHDLLVDPVLVEAELHFLDAHDDVVAHVETELTHLALLDEGPVLSLPLPGGGTHLLALCGILCGDVVVLLAAVGEGRGQRLWGNDWLCVDDGYGHML